MAEKLADEARIAELERCKNDLYYLACKLGYAWNPAAQQGVTAHFHRDACARRDRLKLHSRVADFAQRKSLKSTIFTVVEDVQDILRDPDITILTLHMAEDEAVKLVEEVGHLFMKNEYLRSLDPIGIYPEGHKNAGKPYNVCPDKRQTKFVTSKGFTIKTRPGMNPTTRRQQTAVGKGLTSTLTGIHVDKVNYDDIIGLETLADGTGMQKAVSVMRSTITNVLNAMGRIRCVGTRWDDHDVYATQIINSKAWSVAVRHAVEHDDGSMGALDSQGNIVAGEVTHYGPTVKGGDGIKEAREREKVEFMEMGPTVYAAQRMNDPSPAGEKPWVSDECENYITAKEAAGPGRVFILSDPAPATVGSHSGEGERLRGDGTKDDWAWAAIKIQVHGGLQRAVLLDLDHSKHWDLTTGLTQCASAMVSWRTNMFFNEAYGGLAADYSENMKAICRSIGTSLYTKDGKLPAYNNSYVSGAKNVRFAALADWAKTGRFVICETVPKGKLDAFLEQARGWRPIGKRNSNKYDDVADVVSRCTDSALQQFSPRPQFDDGKVDARFNSGPFRRPEKVEESLCRYWHVAS